MLFHVKDLADDTANLAAALRAHDANARVDLDAVPGQIRVAAQMTSDQIVGVLGNAGYEANRVSEPRQIHVSGGSTCCGSCS
jgi:copper chaperone